MIAVVFKKELLSHLLSRQFAICTTLAVLLMSTNGLVSSQNWTLKKASYQAKRPSKSKSHAISLIMVCWPPIPSGRIGTSRGYIRRKSPPAPCEHRAP